MERVGAGTTGGKGVKPMVGKTGVEEEEWVAIFQQTQNPGPLA